MERDSKASLNGRLYAVGLGLTAIGTGALLVFTPASAILIPGIIVVALAFKLRGGSTAPSAGDNREAVDAQRGTGLPDAGGNAEAMPAIPDPPPAPPSPAPPSAVVPAASSTPESTIATVATVTSKVLAAEAPMNVLAPVSAPATGGAAVLARLRQQRASAPVPAAAAPTITAAAAGPSVAPRGQDSVVAAPAQAPAPAPAPAVAAPARPPVKFLFGSQTGTCQEIARNLAAEALQKGFNAAVCSLNELSFPTLSPDRTPLLVIVSSSTGDGDPPDNAASFFTAMRRKPPPGTPAPIAPLVGVRYTVLGLGDSNYTRFMYVPRSIKSRLAELGAAEFYRCTEADEVEGVENVVEPWTEGLWEALGRAAETGVEVKSDEVPTQRVSNNGPSRRSVELLAGAAAKAPVTPRSTNATPRPGASTSGMAPTGRPAATTAPSLQQSPTRGLVAEAVTSAVPPVASEAPPAPAISAGAAPKVEDVTPAAAAAVAPAAAAAAPATGGAAILARFRQQRTDTASTDPAAAIERVTTPTAAATAAAEIPAPVPAAAAVAPAKPAVKFLFGSQTGTCQEIARNLAAEALQKGFNATVCSLNELGFPTLSPDRTPLLVIVSSSTGDGDPPDNAASFFTAMRRKPPPGAPAPVAPLAGVRYTVLGLGDSNYTRFMYVPRSIKGRLAELGAAEFYRCAEADEVEGIESVVEPWTEGLWGPLRRAVVQMTQASLVVEVVNGPAAVAASKAAAAAKPPAPEVDAAAVAAAAAAAAKAAEEAAARAAAEAAAKAAAEEAAVKAAAEAAAKVAAEEAAAKAAAEEAAAKAAAEEAAAKAAAEEAAAKAAEEEAAAKAAAEAAAAEAAAADAGPEAKPEDAAQASAAEQPAPEEASSKEDGAVQEASAHVDAAAFAAAEEAPDADAAQSNTEAQAEAEASADASEVSAQAEAAAAAEVAAVEAAADVSASAPQDSSAPAPEASAAPTQEEPAAAPADGQDAPSPSSPAPEEAEAAAAAPESTAQEAEAASAEAAPADAEGAAPASEAAAPSETDAAAAFEAADGVAAAAVAARVAQLESFDPLLTPSESLADPPSTAGGSVAGGEKLRRAAEVVKKVHDVADGARRRKSMLAKPINVNFPKREEQVVKRKDEKSYGMLMGLAPVGVDTKNTPALLPPRLRIVWEKDEGRARAVREREVARPTREERHKLDPEGAYSAAQPFWAHITDARYETAFWSDRKVLHLEFSIRGSNMAYEPGDAIGVLPINHPDLVTNLCKRLKQSPDRVLHLHAAAAGSSSGMAAEGAEGGAEGGAAGRVASHLPSPASLGYLLSHCVDLTGVTRKSVLRMLAEHTRDAAERRTLMYLSARGGKEAYAHEIGEHQPSLLDLLVRFPSCTPPLDALLDALPPLAPRMYSASSSRRVAPNRISVALSVVRFKTRYGTRQGVASTWLDRLAAPFTVEALEPPAEPIWVPVYLRRAADFKPPADLATPLIMVGPGTGVAPFRGFLQERRAAIEETKPSPDQLGEALLFYGCRREDEDFLYRNDLEGFAADGTLSGLHVAFSRAKVDKVYVQDLLKEQGEKVWSLLQAGAHVYVCGDGVAMAKDVHAALAGIVAQHGAMSEADATAYLQELTSARRYVRDVW